VKGGDRYESMKFGEEVGVVTNSKIITKEAKMKKHW